MRQIDALWAGFFGLEVETFLQPGLRVVPHAGLHGYHGAWLFRHGETSLISAPPQWVDMLCATLQHYKVDALTDAACVQAFGEAVDTIVGPAYQGFLEPAEFRAQSSSARLLSPQDDEALRGLAQACEGQEWEHASIEVEQPPNFGCIVDDQLVAVANCSPWFDSAARPGLLTHPHYRGQGYGTAVLSAATQYGLDQGFVLLYQTLVSNQPAIAAAQRLGYRPYATHLAVRLKPD